MGSTLFLWRLQYYYLYKHEIAIYNKDYTKALEFLEKALSWGASMSGYYSKLSYLLVVSEEYEKLIKLSSTHKDKLESIECDTFKVNYQYAAQQIGSDKYDAVCLRNIIASTNSPVMRLGAFAVLGQSKDVKRILSEQINISYLNYYRFLRWPIIGNEILASLSRENAA